MTGDTPPRDSNTDGDGSSQTEHTDGPEATPNVHAVSPANTAPVHNAVHVPLPLPILPPPPPSNERPLLRQSSHTFASVVSGITKGKAKASPALAPINPAAPAGPSQPGFSDEDTRVAKEVGVDPAFHRTISDNTPIIYCNFVTISHRILELKHGVNAEREETSVNFARVFQALKNSTDSIIQDITTMMEQRLQQHYPLIMRSCRTFVYNTSNLWTMLKLSWHPCELRTSTSQRRYSMLTPL
ncbi:hypothetical protein BKA93DRAFT_825583 [Sparassis latifolia]